jgi:hypothetical protein
MRDREPTLAANEPALDATSSQTAPWTHIRCIQSPEAWAVRKKLDSLLVRTHSVRFIGSYPGIKDRGKGAFSPDTGGRCDEEAAW